jgi:N-ethylmaleimide reductase
MPSARAAPRKPFSSTTATKARIALGSTFSIVRTRGALHGLLYLHLVSNPHSAFPATARAIRGAFGGPLVVNGGFERERAELALATEQAELVAFGRPFIANPDLVARLQRGAPLAAPRPDRFYTPGAEGYIDYPLLAG